MHVKYLIQLNLFERQDKSMHLILSKLSNKHNLPMFRNPKLLIVEFSTNVDYNCFNTPII